MSIRHRDNEEGGITLLEAIETLCAIAEIPVDPNIEIEASEGIILGERKSIEWLNLEDREETVRVVREIFSLLYKYLRGVYKNKEQTAKGDQIVEGIKTIMVLVGEAAKNLDKYTSLFHGTHSQKITQLDEYKKLQQFYQNRISRQVDTKQLSKWILGLAHQPTDTVPSLKGRANLQTRHEFVDLESVKRDSEYELFYIRKEDGSRFFSPQLVRNITLVCDFGESISSQKQATPAINAREWRDLVARTTAADIRDAIAPMIPRFVRETFKQNNHEIIVDLRSAFYALILAANPANCVSEDEERKTCYDYFCDFFFFLRRSLSTRDYQRMVAYPSNEENAYANAVVDMIHAICFAYFVETKGNQALLPPVNTLIKHSLSTVSEEHQNEKLHSDQLWSSLACDYEAMTKYLRRHPNGPLIKVLTSIQEGAHHYYDPLWQGNFPSQFFSLFTKDSKIMNCRIPCPVHQEAINKLVVTDEFKAFMQSMKDHPVHDHHLIINFQDRTSWREHTRSKAMEDLQNVPEFAPNLTVVTLAKDTDFYRQTDSYGLDNHAAVFIESLLDHLEDQSTGYYFPDPIREQLFPKFMHQLVDTVHRIFFNDKNVLTRDQRQDFIELVYLFIEIKIIEMVRPYSFTLMCKDGIDVSTCANGLLYCFFKLLNQEKTKDIDEETLNTILYGPALLQRERIIIAERFHRMVNAIRVIEAVRHEWGYDNFHRIIMDSFGKLFDTTILESWAIPPK